MSGEWLWRYLTFYVLLINTCKKNTPHPLLKNFMEIGGVKKNYSYPPGRGPPTWAFFAENVCKNERIGSRGGRALGTPPRSANGLYIINENICIVEKRVNLV